MWDIEVFQNHRGWSVRLKGETPLATFPTFDQAERRARWMAVRHTVRGADAQIRIIDLHGRELGRWIDERFIATLKPVRCAA